MKRILLATLVASMAVAAPMAYAQPDRDRGGDRHDQGGRGDQNGRGDQGGRGDFHRHAEWRKGYHMRQEDWSRGQQIDWRSRHLRRPPRGYEWREVDGNYVLAAAATGIIASIIANSR